MGSGTGKALDGAGSRSSRSPSDARQKSYETASAAASSAAALAARAAHGRVSDRKIAARCPHVPSDQIECWRSPDYHDFTISSAFRATDQPPTPSALLAAKIGAAVKAAGFSTRSVSVAGNGPAQTHRRNPLQRHRDGAAAILSDRAISRSLAPHSCLSRRISRTRRIDTLLAGINPPARHCHDEQSAEYRPAVERLPPLQGWPTSDRNGRDQIGISGRLHSRIGGRLHSRIGGRLPPEYASSAAGS